MTREEYKFKLTSLQKICDSLNSELDAIYKELQSEKNHELFEDVRTAVREIVLYGVDKLKRCLVDWKN